MKATIFHESERARERELNDDESYCCVAVVVAVVWLLCCNSNARGQAHTAQSSSNATLKDSSSEYEMWVDRNPTHKCKHERCVNVVFCVISDGRLPQNRENDNGTEDQQTMCISLCVCV